MKPNQIITMGKIEMGGIKRIESPSYVMVKNCEGFIYYHPLPIHVEFGPDSKDGSYISLSTKINGFNEIDSENEITYSIDKKEYDRLMLFFNTLQAMVYHMSDI